MDRFDRIAVGDTAEITHAVTPDDLARFVELTGDDNKLHTDAVYAARTALKRPVAHGMLGASFISTVIGTRLPGDGALWFAQSLEFLLPVRVGDTLTVRATVVAKQARDRVVELSTDIFNQSGQKVTTGTAKVRVVAEEAPSAHDAPPARTAFVAGGSGGVGREVCLQLARDGFDVGVHYRTQRDVAVRLVADIEALGRQAVAVGADLADPGQVAEAAHHVERRLGPIGVAVNCAAGPFRYAKLEALDWAMFESELAVALRGAFNLVQAVAPAMAARKSGRIVLLTTQAVDAPAAELAHYVAAKSALAGFAKAIAHDLAPKGVRVNMVAPGMTDTDLIADVPEKTRLLVAARTPLRRLATPADVAGAVSFLASPRADFLTGETIRVNGGQTML
jgi:3-oxoacyl-[acyl-carrier protein] reductase